LRAKARRNTLVNVTEYRDVIPSRERRHGDVECEG